MNKLKTTMDGGMPLELDDIRWEQEAVREGFKAILDIIPVLDASGYIINGCLVTEQASSYLISAGYVYISGEIYKVDEHEVVFGTAGCHYVYEIEVTYDPAGEETYEDLSIQQTYEVRKAKVVVNTDDPFTAANYVQMESDNYFSKVYSGILINILAIETGWYEVGVNPSPGFQQSWANISSTDKVSYKKDSFGQVHMQGVAERNGSADNLVLTLPAGLRPSRKVVITDMMGGNFNSVTINTDGTVVCVGVYANFNCITFKTT